MSRSCKPFIAVGRHSIVLFSENAAHRQLRARSTQGLPEQLAEQGALFWSEFLLQSWGRFQQRLGIGKVVQARRTAARWIRSGAEFLVQQIGAGNDPETYVL